MTIFGALGIAGSGMTVHRKWLDAISDNLSNVNDATSTANPAFQARYVVAQAMGGEGGVAVGGAVLSGDTTGRGG